MFLASTRYNSTSFPSKAAGFRHLQLRGMRGLKLKEGNAGITFIPMNSLVIPTRFIGLAGMTLYARVGAANLDADVGPGNTHAVIPTLINPHINLLRHMAVNALSTLTWTQMPMMIWRIKPIRIVTLAAQAIAFRSQLVAMRLMTISANNTSIIHLALDERAVHIYFVENLSVRVIKWRGEHRQ